MIKINGILALICAAFITLSCSSDDSGGEPDDNNSAAVGTWRLTALNINPPQDIDMDGTPTSNILDELPCATGTIIIDQDGSWSSTIQNLAILTVTGDLFEINCSGSNSQSSGAWLLQGNQLTLFRDFSSVIFTLDGETLTNDSGEDLPGFQSEVYQKQ